MAFYGRLVLEALFLLWLFMDDWFLKHFFFYGLLSSRQTPFLWLINERLFPKHSFFFFFFFNGFLGRLFLEALLLLLCLLEELAKKY
jgi:hypothetical protein